MLSMHGGNEYDLYGFRRYDGMVARISFNVRYNELWRSGTNVLALDSTLTTDTEFGSSGLLLQADRLQEQQRIAIVSEVQE